MPLSSRLQLTEQLTGAPVHRDNPLRVENLSDVGELLVSCHGIAPLTLARTGVRLILLE